jgi:four helix bundle protein
VNKFKQLNVWQKAISLTTDIYRATEKLPSIEKFGLISQINRCTVSIPSNIAEGAGRNSPKEFKQFLGIAIGSSFELETQLIISKNIGYISEEKLNNLMIQLAEI